ncbi:hypothetical protein [Bradyrhizobium erythrophlei]|jgi:hypothetical protein|uniref:Uncharacterized protein n=1 Tax=Bradyrhizobium erythrophlei TaxID=1437360 RepID=A0A1M7UJ03_9BRAD|nr:hypothetical protein [Bradyrhizobium erythrophlei]SHN82895.1 hypothetical protein SAMN05444170_5310 [Bradyrhizobium erythrophlei]
MSTDFSIRPVGAPVPASFPPVASNAAIGGVPTQLPPSQTVTAPDASTTSSNNLPSSNDLSRQAFFDTAAASVVFQSIDSLTGQVVQQFPDDATLRRRTYFHSLDVKDSAPRPLATDVRV